MNKSAQLAIASFLALRTEDDLFPKGSLTRGDIEEAKDFDKEDLFSAVSEDSTFLDTDEFWEKLPELFKYLRDKGQAPTHKDFQKKVNPDKPKTFLDIAHDKDQFKTLLDITLFPDDPMEVEHIFYSATASERQGIDSLEIRRGVAAAMGKTLREDKLTEMGITPYNLRKAIKENLLDNNYRDAKKQISLEDGLLPNSVGDHPFTLRSGWMKFPEFIKDARANGEELNAEFFLFKRADRDSILESAAELDELDRIFNETTLKGLPELALELYENLPEEKKEKIEIDVLVDNIFEKKHQAEYQVDYSSISLESLTTDLNTQAKEKHDVGISPVFALGFEKTWNDIDKVRSRLAEQGQQLKLEHLRIETGQRQETCFGKAVRYGHLQDVLEILADSGEKLDEEDLLRKDKTGVRPVDYLLETETLDEVLNARLWADNIEGLRRLWNAVEAESSDLKGQSKYQGHFQRAAGGAMVLKLGSYFRDSSAGQEAASNDDIPGNDKPDALKPPGPS